MSTSTLPRAPGGPAATITESPPVRPTTNAERQSFFNWFVHAIPTAIQARQDLVRAQAELWMSVSQIEGLLQQGKMP